MKTTITEKIKNIALSTLAILLIWQLLTLVYNPIVLPTPRATFYEFYQIITHDSFWMQVFITLNRLISGLLLAIVFGVATGIVIGSNEKLRQLFEPVFQIVQSTPPISWLVLAMIWFGLDGQAVVFIVFVACLPILIVNVLEGFKNIDMKLVEMGYIYKLSKRKMVTEITLPSLVSYIKSGIIIAVGLGWKLVIMGEVLSTSDGIGAQITSARLNIDTAKVFAWTFVVIIFGTLSTKLVVKAFGER